MQVNHLFLLLTIIVSAAVICCAQAENSVITFDADMERGTNTSLEYHLCTPGVLESNTTMMLLSGTYDINQGDACIVADIENLRIVGDANTTTLIYCTSNILGRNFIFLNITNLIIENVIIENCGRIIPETLPAYVNNTFSFIGANTKSVLFFSQVTNLRLENIHIVHCFGFAFININPRGNTFLDTVTIAHTNNYRHLLCTGTPGSESDLLCAGSGITFLYSDPVPGDPNPSLINETFSLTIVDCVFINNQNYVPLLLFLPVFTSVRSSYQTERILLTGGTAMALYLGQQTYDVDIQIESSVFENNVGYGSSLVIVHYNQIRKALVQMEGCTFESNSAVLIGRGGALVFLVVKYFSELSSSVQFPSDDIHELLSIANTSFLNNDAYAGGAVFFHFTPQNVSDFRVRFDNVTFSGNIAQSGSVLEASIRQATFVQNAIHMIFEDIQAYNNTFPDSLQTTTSTIENSAAFIFIRIYNVTLTGRRETLGSRFFNNSPGAVLASGGNIFLKGYLDFYDNLAYRGAGLSLFDYALLFFHEGSRIKFFRNKALQTGGAIHANSLGTSSSSTCVFQIIGPQRITGVDQIGLLDLSLKFINNTAEEAGNSIYVNPLYGCAFLPEASIVQQSFIYTPNTIYDAIFNFELSVDNGRQEISSIPDKLCFCENETYPDPICGGLNTKRISTLPGKASSVYIVAVDLLFNPVSSLMFAEVASSVHQLGSAQNTRRLSGINCTNIDFNLHGMENTETHIDLFARLGGPAITVEMKLNGCPPGFTLSQRNGLLQCTCDSYLETEILTSCNLLNFTIIRPTNSWLGYLEHVNASDIIFVSTCPIDYCRVDIMYVDLTIPDKLCEPGRTGILCGACNANLSVVFGSAQCMSCSNYWLFTILLYMVIGILLVVCLFLFHLTVDCGTVNGVIFYGNIVSVNANIFFQKGSRGFLFIVISIINLELGFPLCFYDGMNEAAKIGLQFIFPTYLLLLCLLLIFLSRWSSKVAKLISCHGIHVLATLCYLSYSKILRTVIDILSVTTLKSEEKDQPIWLYDGNFEYFTRSHIILVITAALVILAFIVTYTVPLVLIKQVEKYSHKLKPIFDSYAGPFKDRFRFWFGLRLVLLVVMCSTYAIIGTDRPRLALTIQLFCLILFSIAQAYCRPFKNKLINIIDLSFMVNFISMALFALQILSSSSARIDVNLLIDVGFFVGIAIVLILLILGYHIMHSAYGVPKIKAKIDPIWTNLKEMATYSRMKQFRHKVTKKQTSYEEDKNYPTVGTNRLTLSTLNEPTSHTMVSFTDASKAPDDCELVSLRKTETFSKLREPVLDYAD